MNRLREERFRSKLMTWKDSLLSGTFTLVLMERKTKITKICGLMEKGHRIKWKIRLKR